MDFAKNAEKLTQSHPGDSSQDNDDQCSDLGKHEDVLHQRRLFDVVAIDKSQ